MATNSDGSIVLEVKIDKTGLNKELQNLNKDLSTGVKNTKKFNTSITTLTGSLRKFAGAVGIAFSVAQMLRFSNEASKLAGQTEAYILRIGQIYGEASKTVTHFVDENSRALGMSKTAAYEAAASYGNLFSSFADGAENAKLTNDMLQTTAVIASKTGRSFDETFAKIQSGIFGNTRAIDDLGVYVNQATITTTKAFQTISDGRPWADLTGNEQKQILTLAILEQAQLKYGNTVLQSTALTRSQFEAAWQDFKATWGQVINAVLVPILKVITTILNAFTSLLYAIANLTGETVETKKVSQSISVDAGNTSENIGNAVKNQKKLNKELKKSVAGFDDLQVLSDKTSDNVGDSAGGGGGAGGATIETPEISGGDGGKMPDFKGTWQSTLASLLTVAAGALLAIGLILLFFGNIPWGIGFIVGGATLFAITAFATSNMDISQIGQFLGFLGAVTGVLLITIGILLCFFSNIPWGIGFIVSGGIMLAVTAYTTIQNMSTEEILVMLSKIMGFVSGALIAIGVILCCLGSYPWGIGFIIAGAASLMVSIATLSKMDTTEIQDILSLIVAIASGALLALGIILIAFTGPSPLSIGLIIAGAIGLAGVATIDSTKTKNQISKFFEDNKAIIVGVSLVLLVIGIILCCTGVALPLGIALIAAGATALVTEVALNWDKVKEQIKKVMNGILEFLKVAMKLVIGVMLCMMWIGLPFGIALILSGVGDIVEAATIEWDKYGDKIKEKFNDVLAWIKTWGLLVLGVILCISGVGLPLGIALIKEGGANLTKAQDPLWGAITDKVKETWEKIKQYWKDNIAKYFAAEWWGELGRKAINGLLDNVISGINKLIKAVNKINFKMPDALGGAKIGFNIPEIPIPKLAKGAVLPANKPFLAMVGDQKTGTNVEAPAELIKQMAKEGIAEIIQNVNLNSTPQTIILTLDGREVGRTFGKAITDEAKRSSSNFVKSKFVFG